MWSKVIPCQIFKSKFCQPYSTFLRVSFQLLASRSSVCCSVYVEGVDGHRNSKLASGWLLWLYGLSTSLETVRCQPVQWDQADQISLCSTMSPDASCWKDWGGINTDCWAGTHGHHRPGSPRLARCALMTQRKAFLRWVENLCISEGQKRGERQRGRVQRREKTEINAHAVSQNIWGTSEAQTLINIERNLCNKKYFIPLWLDTTKPTFSGVPLYGKDPISFHVSTSYVDFKQKAAKHDVTFSNKAQLPVDILILKYLTFTATYSSLNRLTYSQQAVPVTQLIFSLVKWTLETWIT